MDNDFLARFRERSAYEAARDGPPEGFPKLPDLPLGRYTDPFFQELEHEYLFKRVWLYAAHDSELPEPGDYKLCDIVGAPILVARGDDGVVRAFYNACRHRGAPVVRGTTAEALSTRRSRSPPPVRPRHRPARRACHEQGSAPHVGLRAWPRGCHRLRDRDR